MRISGMNYWTMSAVFALKVFSGFIFLYIYTYIYGDGALSEDAGVFMRESHIINAVFLESPADYFRLFFNIGDQRELVDTYLQDTFRWDAGPMGFTSDNRNMLRFHSIIHFFSFNTPAIHMLVMAFISTIGVKQLFLGIKGITSLKNTVTLLILVLLPSAFFWCSGILKEPFMLLGIGLLLRAYIEESSLRKRIVLSSLGIITLLLFKPFVLLAIIPCIILIFLFGVLKERKVIGAFGVLMLLIISSVLLFPSKKTDIVHLLSRKQFDFNNVGKGGLHAMIDTNYFYVKPEQVKFLTIEGDSVWVKQRTNAWRLRQGRMDTPIPIILEPSEKKWYVFDNKKRSAGYFEVSLINDSFSQLLYNMPEAIVNSLFRPFITDTGSFLKYPAILEMLLVFIFLIYAIIKRKNIDSKHWRIIYIILTFILVSSLIIGWVTPVSGAIVRYRIPVYYGIVIISMILMNPSANLRKKHIDQ